MPVLRKRTLASAAVRGHEWAAIAFSRIYSLAGERLRRSFLGPKALEPDIACFSRKPRSVQGAHGLTSAAPDHIRLVIEVLSADTWESDLGIGEADKVDRMRTYLESGVPEYWILNAGVRARGCPLPPRAVRLLVASRRGKPRWIERAPEDGVARSASIRGLSLDLAAYWKECGR